MRLARNDWQCSPLSVAFLPEGCGRGRPGKRSRQHIRLTTFSPLRNVGVRESQNYKSSNAVSRRVAPPANNTLAIPLGGVSFNSLVSARWSLSTIIFASTIRRSVVLIFPSESLQSLLLRVRIDVCANDESDGVEEWHPHLVRQECLGEGKSKWRGDPGNLHDWHEACSDSGADLVECSSSRNHGHTG